MKSVLKALILPPGLQIILLGLGLYLVYASRGIGRKQKLGYGFLCGGLISFVLLSLPIVVAGMFQLLEIHPPLSRPQLDQFDGQVIVVLSAGRDSQAPEWQRDVSGPHTAMRLRYAAHLQRQMEIPLLLSGGGKGQYGLSMAEIMARDLAQQYGIEVDWIEPKSRTTWENAKYSSEILKGKGVSRVILVTQAWHMPRAVLAFQHFGLQVLPASTGYYKNFATPGVRRYLPDAHSFYIARIALHEYVGVLVYKLRMVFFGDD